MLIIIYFSVLSFLRKEFLSEHDKHYIFIDILNLTLILFFEVVKMRNSLKKQFLTFWIIYFYFIHFSFGVNNQFQDMFYMFLYFYVLYVLYD